MSDPQRPSRPALGLISLAVRALPRGEVRRRYARELMAQLYDLSPKHQAAFAANVLLTCRSLRGALVDAGSYRGEGNIMITFPRVPLRCRLNLKHHYVRQGIEDSHDQVVVCQYCGREAPGFFSGGQYLGGGGT